MIVVYLMVAVGAFVTLKEDGEVWYWAALSAAVWPAFAGALLINELGRRYPKKRAHNSQSRHLGET